MAQRHWMDKNLREILDLASHSLFADEIASRPGFLQSLDPRIRAVSLLAFILAVLFSRSFSQLALLYICSLILAATSRLSLGAFLTRTWVFIPLFSLFISLPALTSFVTPGPAMLTLGPVTLTWPGARTAAFFVLRVASSVSFAILLTLTTRHFELLKVLRVFRVPAVFVMVLGMTWRYVFLFVETLEHTFLAVRSRAGAVSGTRHGQRLASWTLANLWQRSYQYSGQVYDAMRSRGYQGEVILAHGFKTKIRDWFWLAGLLGILFLTWNGIHP